MLIITIHNDGGTNESSNYTYVVSVNKKVICAGEVKGHNRDDGWENLLEMIVKERKMQRKIEVIKQLQSYEPEQVFIRPKC